MREIEYLLRGELIIRVWNMPGGGYLASMHVDKSGRSKLQGLQCETPDDALKSLLTKMSQQKIFY